MDFTEEGKTVPWRVRNHLAGLDAQITAQGVRDRMPDVQMRHVLKALDMLCERKMAERQTDADNPRPRYRRAAAINDLILQDQVEKAFDAWVSSDDALRPAAAPAADPMPKAAASVPAAAPGTMRGRILAILKADETTSRDTLFAALGPQTNKGSFATTMNLMRNAGEIVEVSSGRYSRSSTGAGTSHEMAQIHRKPMGERAPLLSPAAVEALKPRLPESTNESASFQEAVVEPPVQGHVPGSLRIGDMSVPLDTGALEFASDAERESILNYRESRNAPRYAEAVTILAVHPETPAARVMGAVCAALLLGREVWIERHPDDKAGELVPMHRFLIKSV